MPVLIVELCCVQAYEEFEDVARDVLKFLEACEWAADLLYSEDKELRSQMRILFRQNRALNHVSHRLRCYV